MDPKHLYTPDSIIMTDNSILDNEKRRRMNFWRFKRRFGIVAVTVLVLSSLASLVDCQKTENAKLLQKTLVDLHDPSLDTNKDLDLTAEPVDAAQQVMDRIGASVSARASVTMMALHRAYVSHFLCLFPR